MPVGFNSTWNSAAAAVSCPQVLDAHVRGIPEAGEHFWLTRLERSGRFHIHKRLGGISGAEVDGSANRGRPVEIQQGVPRVVLLEFLREAPNWGSVADSSKGKGRPYLNIPP
jgi:hypothetical protein